MQGDQFLNPGFLEGLNPGARPTRVFGFARITRATITVLLLMHGVATAQDVTEPSLKAAFIYNFAKFTDWPVDVLQAAEPVVMCVLGDAAVGEALERAVKSRVMAGHSLEVWNGASLGSERVCHVLYVSGITVSEATRVIAVLRETPVLTISDIEGFTELGGIAQFFFDRGQLRFMIAHDSAKRARLQISAKLLSLARLK